MTTKFGHSLEQSIGDPIIIWLQGGPGGPSQFGSWCEIGPIEAISLQPQASVQLRENSWSDIGMLLFIDQPLLVGGSWINNGLQVNTTQQASEVLIAFLENFFAEFHYLGANPLYITGESYAGHYIPQLAYDLLQSKTLRAISNFQGVAIGDGLTMAMNQLTTYSQYGFVAGLISSAQQRQLQQNELNFYAMEEQGDYVNAMNYNQDNIQNQLADWTGTNLENFQQYAVPDAYPAWFNLWSSWIIANRKQYGIGSQVPNDQIAGNNAMFQWFTDSGDIGSSFLGQLSYVMNNTRVLLYNGQLDTLVNSPGVQNMLQYTTWKHYNSWYAAEKQLLELNGNVLGNFKTFADFTFAIVYGAGHLVPADQPVSAHYLLKNWIAGTLQ